MLMYAQEEPEFRAGAAFQRVATVQIVENSSNNTHTIEYLSASPSSSPCTSPNTQPCTSPNTIPRASVSAFHSASPSSRHMKS